MAIIDGIFGSNESSRAIASIITLVHRELINDPEFALTKVGKVAILSGLTKAMTAFAVLQNVTHKRTMKHMKITLLWKGLVVEEEEKSQALIQQYESKGDNSTSTLSNQEMNTDIIHELEEILANTSEENEPDQGPIKNGNANNSLISLSSTSSNLNGKAIDLSLDPNGDPYNMYEIITTTNRITTRTTRITPINADGTRLNKAKQIIERTDEEENEAFVAMIDHDKQPHDNEHRIADGSSAGTESQQLAPFQYNQTIDNTAWRGSKPGSNNKFRIMLSSVSKKLSRKKVERQTKYDTITNRQKDGLEETIQGPVTTRTSISTTLQAQETSIASGYNSPSVFSDGEEEDESCFSEPDNKSKRRMSWSGLKMKSLGKKKSVSNFFQKGAESRKKKKPSSTPPLPVQTLKPSTSITSLSRTLKTTTFTNNTTAPTPSSSRSLTKSPSVPSRLNLKNTASPLDIEPSPQNFPRKHIITNIAYFIRYASAAYGESFMRILGIGDIPTVLPNSHHPNHHAFAHHTGVSVEDILLSSYTDNHILSSMGNSKLHALVHYVTVDHRAEAIVLTCRGTLGLSDVLTDLTCDYKEFTLPEDTSAGNSEKPRSYVAHGGMLEAAQLLATQKGKVFETIKKGLIDYPTYGLVICGHSLGAGVASLLSVLWSEERLHYLSRKMKANHDDDGYPHKFLDSFAAASIKKVACPFVTSDFSGLPPGRPIHCYTYGSPCVMSLPLSEYCGQGLVTSVVHAFDIVSGLSLGLLKDFKNVAVSLHEDSHVTDEILSRVVGHYQKKDKEKHEDEESDQWFWALIKTMRADMKADKLYPPSTMYLIESVPQLVQHSESESHSYRSNAKQSNHKRAHMVKFSKCEDIQARFSEIVFSRTMFMDHSPYMYEKAIHQLNKGYFG